MGGSSAVRTIVAAGLAVVGSMALGLSPASGLTLSHTIVPSTWSVAPAPNPSVPSPSRLDGVSCVTATFCAGVGGEGDQTSSQQQLIETYNGSSWSVAPRDYSLVSPNNYLSSVSCAGIGFCMAVGVATPGSTEQPSSALMTSGSAGTWDDVQPSLPTPNVPTSLNAVSCPVDNWCMAVGGSTQENAQSTSLTEIFSAGQWNGISYPAAPPTGTVLTGVSCTSTSSCTAVGTNFNGTRQAFAEQWNGTTWTAQGLPMISGVQRSQFNGVSCVTWSLCMAVGSYATTGPSLNLIEEWDGSSWSVMPAPQSNNAGDSVLLGVNCFGPTSCAFVGQNDNYPFFLSGQAQIVTWNGSTFATPVAPTNSATLSGLSAVSCAPGSQCAAVGFQNLTDGMNAYALSSPIAPNGYYEVGSDGGIFAFGGATFYGSTGGMTLNKPIVGMQATADGGGYWLVASDGGIFAYGDAQFFGSTGGMTLNKPIVGMEATPDGQGYWLVGSDGGIFSFGDAAFYGSTGALTLNKPIVGMVAAPGGTGYWLVGSDGGIFSYGSAIFYGSAGGLTLNQPIVGMALSGGGTGYYLVASDGGIFSYGSAVFYGSTGSLILNKPIVAMAVDAAGTGYYEVGSDGGIFCYGSAMFYGSTGSMTLNAPIVDMAV